MLRCAHPATKSAPKTRPKAATAQSLPGMLVAAAAIVLGLVLSDLVGGRARPSAPLPFRRGGRVKFGI